MAQELPWHQPTSKSVVELPPRGRCIDRTGHWSKPRPGSLTRGPAYLRVANVDANVREVLKLLGGDFADWMTLYKVYEVIRDDGDPARWATKAEYRVFTGSANHPLVSGSDGRHARAPSPSPPKRTMTIDEGRAFIQRVALAWISSK